MSLRSLRSVASSLVVAGDAMSGRDFAAFLLGEPRDSAHVDELREQIGDVIASTTLPPGTRFSAATMRPRFDATDEAAVEWWLLRLALKAAAKTRVHSPERQAQLADLRDRYASRWDDVLAGRDDAA